MLYAEQMRRRLGLDPDDGGMDEVIEELIMQAEAFGRAYCRLRPGEALPDTLTAQMVAEDFGRMEGAGLSKRTLSGMAETYRGAYSDGILSILRSMRHPAVPSMRRDDV